MKVCTSLAAWPGLSHLQAVGEAMAGSADPMFGALAVDHVQLVPQSAGLLSEEAAAALRTAWPATRFRLHANVRVLPLHRLADLSNLEQHRDWFLQAARVSGHLGASVYTAHAGRRRNASLEQVLDNTRRAADLFGCMVGVEGLYPSQDVDWLVSTWDEYRQIFESGVPYVLDLSHVHILATQSGHRDMGLLAEMLACPHCIEVHVSANDGRLDTHRMCSGPPPWWAPLLTHLHLDAVVFSEGNQRRPSNKELP